MYAQAAIKSNTLLRNGAYGIVMRGVQKCTRGCSSLRGRNRLPLCCIKLDTATYPNYGCGVYFVKAGEVIEWNYTCDLGCDLENGDPYGYGKEWKDNHD